MHQAGSSEAETSDREALQDAAHIVHLGYSKAKRELKISSTFQTPWDWELSNPSFREPDNYHAIGPFTDSSVYLKILKDFTRIKPLSLTWSSS